MADFFLDNWARFGVGEPAKHRVGVSQYLFRFFCFLLYQIALESGWAVSGYAVVISACMTPKHRFLIGLCKSQEQGERVVLHIEKPSRLRCGKSPGSVELYSLYLSIVCANHQAARRSTA